MEAHGVREFLPETLRGRFVRRALQAAVADVILPAFVEQVLELAAAGQPLTRDLAARATVCLRARIQYGIVDSADLNGAARAITQGTRQIDKRTPGARFDGRAYARGRAEQATGRPVTTHPWRVTRHFAAPIQEPHVGLIIDTSGSTAGYEYALGPIAWILTDGLRRIGGRCATALFGNSAELLVDGTQALALDALELASNARREISREGIERLARPAWMS